MIRGKSMVVVAITSLALVRANPLLGGECYNGEFCTDPCPAENTCWIDADCPEGMWCVEPDANLPSLCWCVEEEDRWQCWFDGSWECVEPPAPTGPPAYVIIDLGTLGGHSSVGLGVNDVGQVVGGADTSDGLRHAFLWSEGVMTDLGTLPGGHHSEAWDINNLGQVVANSSVTGAGAWSAFLWDNGEKTDLGHLLTSDTSGFAINDAGQAVGYSHTGPEENHAFLWENGVMTDLTAGGWGSSAWDINASGQVVGAGSLDGASGQACMWEDGVMTILGTLGGEMSWARAINDPGQVVGSSERSPGDHVFHAFLWEDGQMTDLGALLGFPSSSARAINNDEQVIVSGGLYHAETGLERLKDLIPVCDRWYELTARDINNAGQIVGAGTFQGRRHAFLMTPIDADFDDDDDTDLVDFEGFRSCLTGPGAAVAPECKGRDIDRDGDIDLCDYRALQWVFTGS